MRKRLSPSRHAEGEMDLPMQMSVPEAGCAKRR